MIEADHRSVHLYLFFVHDQSNLDKRNIVFQSAAQSNLLMEIHRNQKP